MARCACRNASKAVGAPVWHRLLPFLDPGNMVEWLREVSVILEANDIDSIVHFATAPSVSEWCNIEVLSSYDLGVLESFRKGIAEVCYCLCDANAYSIIGRPT